MNKIPRFKNPSGNRHDRAQPIPVPKRRASRPVVAPPPPELEPEVESWVNEGGAGGESA